MRKNQHRFLFGFILIISFCTMGAKGCHSKYPQPDLKEIPMDELRPGLLPLPEVDQLIQNEMKSQRLVGTSVAIIEGGMLRYLRGYGWSNYQKAIQLRATTSKIRWASISKPITGIAAILAQRDGHIDLDKDIRNYYSNYSVPCHYILPGGNPAQQGHYKLCQSNPNETVALSTRMLLGNLGGIQHYENGASNPVPPKSLLNHPQKNTGLEWALRYWISNPFVSIPGSEFHYSTFGFNLAGVVLEKATGIDFATWVKEKIALPLEMTSFQPDYRWKKIPGRAIGYDRNKNGKLFVDSDTDVSWKMPGGGFTSTVEDLGKLCLGLIGNDLLSEEEKKNLWTEQETRDGKKTGYGLGFHIRKRWGARAVLHAGSQDGTSTFLVLYPKRQFCVALMSNNHHGRMNEVSLKIERGLITGEW